MFFYISVASLLSCLHQLQSENGRLEDHVKSLIARRDHLLAVNARLAIPLNSNIPQSQGKRELVPSLTTEKKTQYKHLN